MLHPLDGLAEGVSGFLSLADMRDQFLLKLVAVLHAGRSA
jgi:hypothetical protein